MGLCFFLSFAGNRFTFSLFVSWVEGKLELRGEGVSISREEDTKEGMKRHSDSSMARGALGCHLLPNSNETLFFNSKKLGNKARCN